MWIGTYLQEPKNLPISERRGIEIIDLNDKLIIVQACIEDLGQQLEQVIQYSHIERDIYEREIRILGKGVILLQFQGHCWTTILFPPLKSSKNNSIDDPIVMASEIACTLSRLLETKAIYYQVSDTGCYIGYQFFENGDRIEELYFSESVVDTKNCDLPGEQNSVGYCTFFSTQRQIDQEYLRLNAYSTVFDFVKNNDAYIPAILWNSNYETRQEQLFYIEGLEKSDLLQIDYVTIFPVIRGINEV